MNISEKTECARTEAYLLLEYLIRANETQNPGTCHLAEIHLLRCAEAMGFRLEPALTPAQAHEAAIARRRAEEIDDGGFEPATLGLR